MNASIKKLTLPGIVFIAGAGVAYSIQEAWTLYHTAAAVIGAAGLAVSLVARREQIRGGLTGRQGRHGANYLISIVLLVGVLSFVNYLAVQNDQRVDMTAEGFNTLAEQSVTVADQIVDPVHIRAFYPGGEDAAVRQLLDLYGDRDRQITYEFIDPDQQPQLAEQFEVTVYGFMNNPLTGQNIPFGTLILEMGDFAERVESQELVREEDLTNALMKLVRGEQKTIYFVEGHGEKTIDSGEQGGMDTASQALDREGYAVATINLIVDGVIPEDAAVLIWPGPENEPFDEEVDMVDEYLNQGGSVLIMVDPTPSASLAALLDRWSIAVGNDFVVDVNPLGRLMGAGPEIPLVSDYGLHAITDRFDGAMTFFPLARSVNAVGEPTGEVSTTNLLMSGPRSWGETDLANTEASMDPEVDLAGPVSLGVVATKDLPSLGEGRMARLVAVGDSEFAGNGYFTQQGNGNLFLNMVRWLAEDESFISIGAKVPQDRPLTLTAAGGRISSYLSIWLPLILTVSIGILVWWSRRQQ